MLKVVVIAYLVGSVPFALLLARGHGAAGLRRIGSGNIGAANVARASGVGAGVAVALLDIAKGATGVLIAERLDVSTAAATAAGLAAIVGHVYPVWLRFRGGKGVATACGAFSVLAPVAAAVALAVFAGCFVLSRYVSLGSLLATATLPPVAYASGSPTTVVAGASAAAALIVFRHRSNLARLRAGTERRFALRSTL